VPSNSSKGEHLGPIGPWVEYREGARAFQAVMGIETPQVD
jgi:hypothetical protein